MTRIVVALSTAVLLSGAGVAIPQIASAVTIAELQASIAALTLQLNALIGAQPAVAGKCTFTRDLTIGVEGDDVMCLQKYLNSKGHQVASSGAGSPGSESTYFGTRTQGAVSKWQAANGVSPTAGYFGSKSRAKYDALVAGTPTPPPPPGPTPPPVVGTGLTVSAATQPGDTLAPASASRIKATSFTVTASSDGDIVVNSVTVERQGPAADSSISSVVLLDENGLQIGLSKTLNANHQAILNNKFTVAKGTSRTITVAINRPASPSDGGSVARMAVVAVDAGAAQVAGSLPIVGSPITMNSTLTIGSATMARGVNDPGSAQTKEIGTNAYKFTAIRATAGSAEDLIMKWVSFNQSGSAAATDIANVKVNVNGTDYPATVSADGKYYTATFGDGIALKKGNQAEIYVIADIVNGSNRTVDFDLYRFTDLYIIGQSFGYGITPTGGSAGTATAGSFSTDTNPIWNAYAATIGAGTVSVTGSTAIPAQNIAVNLNDQPIGAFDVDVKGETVTVSSMVFRVSANKNVASVFEADYTDVKLVDNATGKVIAGPKDGSGTTDTQMVFTFTDAVSFPVGKKTYVLRGKLSTDFLSDTLVSASTTPSSDWTSATGDVSGTSISVANTGTVSGNSYTVKTGAVNVSLSTSPTAQNVIRGAKAFTFANLVFDATNSGEDVRFTSAIVQHNYAVAGDLTNCQLFDGTTALNTGSNIVNPSAASAASVKDNTFTLDTQLTLAKGTSKTVALKCDVSKSGTGNYAQWTFSSNETFGATGLTSGTSITAGVASSSVSNRMALTAAGTFTIAIDPSSPSVRLAQSGQEITASAIRLSSTNENINVTQIAVLLSATASSTASDMVKLSLWDGATKVGEVLATSSTSGIIVTTTGLSVPKDADKIITVKVQLASIANNESGRPGHLVAIDWDNVNQNGLNATYGVGGQSSDNIYATGNDTASAGVRTVRAYPTVNVLSVPSTSLADATQKVLYRFSVSAPAGTNGVSLYKFTFGVATTGDDSGIDFTITNLRFFGFTNSNFSGDCCSAQSGQLNNGSTLASSAGNNSGIDAVRATSTDFAIYFNPAAPTSAAPEAVAIPAGSTYYFELRGDVSGADAGDSASVVLQGDNSWHGVGNTSGGTMAYDDAGFLAGAINYSFATTAPILDSAAGPGSAGENVGATGGNTSASGAGADFIWSGNSTTTHSGASGNSGPDWYNGFVVPGLPATGATAVTFTL